MTFSRLGNGVLERAWTDRHRWAHLGADEPFAVGVNISADQFLFPGFVAMVEGVVTRTSTQRGQLCLDITEGAFIRDAERALEVLLRLKRSGILVALDDFGTGYSSLRYLTEFPFDILKIDQSLIGRLGEDAASYSLVSKTIELAHLLGLSVVCEGVETAKQSGDVEALTSDFSQGFHFSPPMTVDLVDETTKDLVDRAWTIEVVNVP